MKGPGVFKEYLNKPEATAEAFDSEGWFRYLSMHLFFHCRMPVMLGPLCSRLSSLCCNQVAFHLMVLLMIAWSIADACRTGDIVSMEGDPPYWRIVGRASVDIIKSGGYKISAPQIEDAILAHPGIAECAVMGAPDEALGEAVATIIACKAKEARPLKFCS